MLASFHPKVFQVPNPLGRVEADGDVTAEGITADLEAMKRAGIGGAQIFNVDVGIPVGKSPFMTPQWRDAMTHAGPATATEKAALPANGSAGFLRRLLDEPATLLMALAVLILAFLVGCSGRHSYNSSLSTPSRNEGRATFTIHWPAPGRLIPVASSVIGGVLNFAFVRSWARRVQRNLRARHLAQRPFGLYADAPKVVVSLPASVH